MKRAGVLGGVCERCKQQVADCHFVGLVDGREQSQIVCGACYQELVILELIHAKTHCRYCGKPPTVPINDVESCTHHEPTKFLCLFSSSFNQPRDLGRLARRRNSQGREGPARNLQPLFGGVF